MINNMALRNILKRISVKHQQITFLRRYSIFPPFYHRNYDRSNFFRADIFLTNINRRTLSDTYNSDSEQSEFEDEDIEIGHYEKTPIRKLLNENSKDPLIQELNECASVQNVFNIIRQNHTKMDANHISQAVLVLWDLQKIFYKHNVFFDNDNSSNTFLSPNAILKNYINQINAHEDFEKLIQLVEENYTDFSLDALTCTLLYLNRMGVQLKNNVMQLMIEKCRIEIRNCATRCFPLTALSRFVVTVYSQKELWPILISLNTISIVLDRLDSCKTVEDFKLITICLNKLHQLVTNESLEKYKQVAETLINNRTIKSDSHRTIIKTLRFLNHPQWNEYNLLTSTKFMYLLKGNVSELSQPELILLFKVFQTHREPADMLEEIQKHALRLLSEVEDEQNNLEITLDLLSCVVSFSSPLQRPTFEKLAKRYINSYLSPISLTALYKILYHVKSSDIEMCNHFWDKSLEFINSDKSNRLQKLLSVCHKYMHFSSDIGHRYRYNNFEETIINLLSNELNSEKFDTSQFARIASFIIAYSNDSNHVKEMVNKLVKLSSEFDSIDCLNISKGIQLGMENTRNKDNENISKNLDSLNDLLNNSIAKELEKNNKLPNVNILLRGYLLRKQNIENELFKKLMDCYVTNTDFLSSHIVKDLSFTLQMHNCLVPEIIDKITEYIAKKKESILGNTVDKVLYLCYYSGYTPNNYEEFIDVASELIIRDKDRFSGLSFLQSALALCFYHKLPESLVKHIFSVQFLEKLEEELSNCYAKATYPIRVRDHLMQLNRAVCLDYPGSEVPWFHQKYVEEIKKQVPRKDYFNKKVHSTLLEMVQKTDKQTIVSQDVYTPYGYHLDFEVTHKTTNLADDKSLSRVAIILLSTKAFTNLHPNLKGFYQLKQRHLEILGYKVLGINYTEWKSLYTQESCIQYIKNKIWPTENVNVLSSMSC